MVRLEGNPALTAIGNQPCFNSKMVRLEADHYEVINIRYKKFQFQDGAIRGFQVLWSGGLLWCFNSKMVRLEVSFCALAWIVVDSFNSKMVRLEDSLVLPVAEFIISFNSKMVRLEE